jgi:hypothetical protein
MISISQKLRSVAAGLLETKARQGCTGVLTFSRMRGRWDEYVRQLMI